MKIGIEVLCENLPRKLEYRENGLTYRCTLPGRVYEFLPLLSIYVYMCMCVCVGGYVSVVCVCVGGCV